MKELIIDHIRQLLEQRIEKATMIIHPISLDKFIEELKDPSQHLSIVEHLSLGKAARLSFYGLDITIYRSFDISKDKIIIHESTL